MKTLIFLLIANLGLAQSLTPQFGIHWTGGMTYDNDHEAPSAQVGLIYTPKTPDLIISNIGGLLLKSKSKNLRSSLKRNTSLKSR